MRRIAVAVGVLVSCGFVGAAGTHVTVLPGGEGLVSETLDVPAGAAGPLALVRPPTTVTESFDAALLPAETALPVVFAPPLDGLAPLLARCTGQRVLVQAGTNDPATVTDGELVAAGGPDQPALVRRADGYVVPVRWDRVMCVAPGDGRWRLAVELPESKSPRAVRLRYRVGGFAWQARHRLDLDEAGASARLALQAVVDVPFGARYDGAALRLAEGGLPRAMPQPRPMMADKRMAVAAAPEAVVEGEALDFILFDVGTRDLAGPARFTVPLRPPQKVAIEDALVLTLSGTPAGMAPEQPLAPVRHLRFVVPGDRPVPGGTFDVGVARGDGTWVPLGEIATQRLAPGAKADLTLGEVRDLVARYRRPTLETLPAGPFLREAAVEVTLENRRPRAGLVEMRQEFWGPFELVDAKPAPDARDGSSLTWRVGLDKGATKTVTYRLRFDPRPPR